MIYEGSMRISGITHKGSDWRKARLGFVSAFLERAWRPGANGNALSPRDNDKDGDRQHYLVVGFKRYARKAAGAVRR